MQKTKQNESETKNTANVGPGKGQNKRKLRGAVGTGQPDDESTAGKSPKIVKDTNKDTAKETSKKDSSKDSNKDTNKDTDKSQKTADVNKVNFLRRIKIG